MASRTTNTIASDHDLLIRIDTKVDLLQSTVQETRTALSARIDRLAQEKAGYNDLDPLRNALEKLQRDTENLCEVDSTKVNKAEFDTWLEKVDGTRRLVWIGIGILATLQFLVPFLWARLLH